MKDTRERIVAAAYGCFREKGYEQTSVRQILERSGVSTGSFYHFFPSKEALFEAAVERFLQDYVSAFDAVCRNHALPALERCERLFTEVAERIRDYYGQLGGERLHWTLAYSLHEKTLAALLPGLEALVADALGSGTVKSRLELDTRTLSALLLRGMEAILHGGGGLGEADAEGMAYRLARCREYMGLLLEISTGAEPGAERAS